MPQTWILGVISRSAILGYTNDVDAFFRGKGNGFNRVAGGVGVDEMATVVVRDAGFQCVSAFETRDEDALLCSLLARDSL